MINLDIPAIKISLKQQKPLLKDGFAVTYEYGWAEPSNANSTKADNAIQTNANFDASIQCSWNGLISFTLSETVGELKDEGS